MRLQVRCCCNPNVWMGSLEIPDHLAKRGTFEMPICRGNPLRGGEGTPAQIDRVRITVEELELEYGRRRMLAIKSDERPLTWWKQLPGFWLP